MDDAHLRALIGERHPLTAPASLRRAENYLSEQFRLLGLDVSPHPFRALGETYCNVIATIPPSAAAPSLLPPLIIAAHYDTVEGSPGADDNASALAVMLEVARTLRGVPLTRSVRFIAFCLEEENLLGSLAYVSSLQAVNEEICGAIVLECVGYARSEEGSQQKPPGVSVTVPTVGDFLGIVGNSASAHLVKAVEAVANQAVPELRTISLVVPGNGELLPDTRRSDHAAFWHYGYPAVMLTDTANFRNPHYHRPTDTLDMLSLAFMEQVARAITAAAIALCSTTPHSGVQCGNVGLVARLGMAFPVCPQCTGEAVYRVYRPGMLEALLRVVAVHSFRCVSCDHRFRAFLWGRRGRPVGHERREFDRIPVRLTVVFSSEHFKGKGTVLNLSMDGCLIEADTVVPVDTLLNVKLFVSEQGTPVEFAGTVRSVNGKRIGIQFTRS